eukprot:1953168-Rhodomonas_salina.2
MAYALDMPLHGMGETAQWVHAAVNSIIIMKRRTKHKRAGCCCLMLCIATAVVAFAALFGPVDGCNTAVLCPKKQLVFGMTWADLGSFNKSETAVSTAEKFLKVALAKVKHTAAMKAEAKVELANVQGNSVAEIEVKVELAKVKGNCVAEAKAKVELAKHNRVVEAKVKVELVQVQGDRDAEAKAKVELAKVKGDCVAEDHPQVPLSRPAQTNCICVAPAMHQPSLIPKYCLFSSLLHTCMT